MRFLIAEADELEQKGIEWLISTNQIPHQEILRANTPQKVEQVLRQEKVELLIINLDLFNEFEWLRIKNLLKYMDGTIIIHSAHQTFRTAREALEVNAKGLFIQPISPNEWSASVRKIVRHANLSDKQTKSNAVTQDSNMYRWLFDYHFEMSEVRELLERGKSKDPKFVSVIEIDSTTNLKMGRSRVLQIIQEELQEYSPYVIPTEEWIVLIFNVKALHHDARLTDFESIFIRLLRLLKEQYDISITVGLGNEYTDIYKLRDSYVEAKTSIKRKFYYGINQVFRYGHPFALHTIDPILTPEEQEKLVYFLTHQDRQGIKEYLFDLFLIEYNDLDQFPHPDFIRIKLTSVMANIRRFMLRNEDLLSLEKQYQLMFNDILNGEELSVIVQKLVYFCYSLFSNLNQSEEAIYSKVTQGLIEYIEDHYFEKVSLHRLADQVGKNKYYLSHLFKRETGQSMSEYIQKVRIENAKHLIETTEKSMQEIGYLVGYEDQSYFSRMFKKWNSMSPNAYKNNIIKK
ncbi:helix-turn-helix domain-containing protein [Tenuibacillus multivorans]|uniref:Two-component response regulator, YesN/AraC family, consists of REC and AraC-type DNA-binding domains n=1 Tax=Tenuibacillus multivorans TaxID=237069 RepID=A0A1G9WVE2_9BACI|nr:helix-turn-helix domain-containing protein [Tenuibacillus multivorans]GEL78421.1 DNA-binding response regulator [Tenuibacillus multivorans]SDM88083.1 Two-component response regulator, YesN/AraC family, consists of REC and AraC-type DNA-binding domains [Tenuibacillus multivorans]